MSSKAFKEQQRKARVIEELGESYAKVARHYHDGRPALAVDLCGTIVETADELGDAFTTTQFPVCLACTGSAEMPSFSESDRKMRCQDQPTICKGNGFGRMHPTQLLAFIEDAAIPRPAPGELPPPSVPDENLGDIRPTPIAGRDAPAPPYVYDRDAVIRFNELREANEHQIPVPEDDEEVLVSADGTFTIRKKSDEDRTISGG